MMHDLSWFMRLLKQRFSRWYNACHKAFGTLWAERFTSVVIEGGGEAVGGRSAPRRGLERVTAAQARYRRSLYAMGTAVKVKGGRKQGAVSDAAAEKVWREQGELGWAVALRDRVGYFSRGGVLGSKEFVDRVFALKRDRFPEGRKDGARKLRGGVDWGGDAEFAGFTDVRLVGPRAFFCKRISDFVGENFVAEVPPILKPLANHHPN